MSSSKCKQCGEQLKSGNYMVKILPSKRIPKKAMKLLKSGKDLEQTCTNINGMTKFQKFLAKRAQQANTLEITCGKCDGVRAIKMDKRSAKSAQHSLSTMESKKQPWKQQKTNQSGSSKYAMNTTTRQQTNHQGQPSPSNLKKRQKELENLNKMLFQSKKAKKSGSTLQDFLSRI